VQRNVDALRGSVAVSSREGAGTTFSIRLPLSLAIVPGFAVATAGETYILPLDAVFECLELPRGELRGPDGSGVLSLRGEPLPCRRLRRQFRLEGESPLREYVVVVGHAGKRLGLVVDDLSGRDPGGSEAARQAAARRVRPRRFRDPRQRPRRADARPARSLPRSARLRPT
jgi:two-component system chemotaxis sensor kinase CheA